MNVAPIESDIATLSRNHEREAPDFAEDEATVLRLLAEFLHSCDVGEYGALTLLMKCAVERGLADDAQGKWPVSVLGEAMRSAYGANWDHEKLWLTLLEVAAMKLHTMPIDSSEVKFYEAQQDKDRTIAATVSGEAREHYERQKARWRRLHVEFDTLIMHREKTLLQREAMRQCFMRDFPMYLEERDQRLRLAMAELKLAELQKDPTLGREALDALANEKLDEASAKLGADRRTQSYALTEIETQFEGFADAKEYQKYRKRLKTLYMLLHPDRLMHFPLTENQRKELRELWDDCQSIDLRNATGRDLGRSAELIERCIEHAQAILGQAGIDIDPGFVIQGKNLEERLLWLDRAILRLQRDIEILKDELKAWRDDKEISAMAALLYQPEQEQEKQRAAMRDRTFDFATQADALEQELCTRLTDGDNNEGN